MPWQETIREQITGSSHGFDIGKRLFYGQRGSNIALWRRRIGEATQLELRRVRWYVCTTHSPRSNRLLSIGTWHLKERECSTRAQVPRPRASESAELNFGPYLAYDSNVYCRQMRVAELERTTSFASLRSRIRHARCNAPLSRANGERSAVSTHIPRRGIWTACTRKATSAHS